jgi:hypothetical protein
MNIAAEIGFLENEISEIEPLIRKIIKDNKGKILTIIKLRLYQKGIDGDGMPILPSYSVGTTKTKKGKSQITSHVTLRDTGEWFGSFYVVYESGEIKVKSDSTKTSQLTSKYGDSILEFTQDELQNIIQAIIEPEIIKRINSSKQIVIDF